MRRCTECKRDKDPTEFSFRDKSSGRLHNRCKCCQRAYGRKHYTRNKKDYIRRAAKATPGRRIVNREWTRELKEAAGCADCGGRFAHWKLQFDHISDDKVENVSRMVQSALGRETIQKEMDKCEVVCANCHADRTWHRHQARMAKR